jgi:hypothetical protein
MGSEGFFDNGGALDHIMLPQGFAVPDRHFAPLRAIKGAALCLMRGAGGRCGFA